MNEQILNRKVTNPDGTVSYVSGASLEDVNRAITAASLAPTTPFKPVEPKYTPIASIGGLNAETLAPLPQETQQSDLIKQIQGLTMDTAGEAGFRAEQEKAQGIPELQKTQSDLSARLKTLQNEALAIPLQLQQESVGRGITEAGLRPIQTAALRNNAIQALSVSSLLEASRGNLTTAQSLADRAVAQKYDPIKAEINAKLANLELLSKDPTLTLAQKNRADAQKAVQESRQRQIEKQEADSKEINSTLNLAIKYGLTDTSLMERIQNASTPIEAKQLASQYLQDPKAQYELNAAKIDILLKQAQLAKVQKETALLGQKTPAERKAEIEAMKSAEGVVPALQNKINVMDAVLNSSALDSVVGTTIFGRGAGTLGGTVGRFAAGAAGGAVAGAAAGAPFAGIGAIPGAIGGAIVGGLGAAGQGSLDKLTGARQDLIASVEQLVSKEFLDSLINVKAQGATFGALTEKEQEALTNAATKIGTWRMRAGDKATGQVIGYNASEESFKKEIKTIQDLARTAMQKAGGNLFADDETSFLDELYQSEGVLNPASFY